MVHFSSTPSILTSACSQRVRGTQDPSLSALQLLDGTGLLAEGLSGAGGSVTLEEPRQKPAVAQAAEGN